MQKDYDMNDIKNILLIHYKTKKMIRRRIRDERAPHVILLELQFLHDSLNRRVID